MSDVIDARGLSCPQPVLVSLEAVKKAGQGRLVVLVDSEAGKENVSRAVQGRGWKVDIQEDEGEYRLVLEK
jgi:TusA-related sulfurtransferase